MSGPRVFVLADPGVADPRLTPAAALPGIRFTISEQPFRSSFDVGGLLRIRQEIAAAKPDVLHAIGPLAVRLSALLPHSRLIVSDASEGRGVLRWLTDRQVRNASQVLAYSQREAEEYRKQGIREERIVRVPPAAAVLEATDGDAFRRSLDIPPNARLILTAGVLDRESRHRNVIWAFDGVKIGTTGIYLVIIGDGPDRERIESFGHALGFDDYRIRFAGTRAEIARLLPFADVVVLPQPRGGQNLALNAMAAGRPIVACQSSDIAELLRDGENGLLVEQDAPIPLGMKMQKLLEDASLADRLGAAGRETAKAYPPERAIAVLERVYTAM